VLQEQKVLLVLPDQQVLLDLLVLPDQQVLLDLLVLQDQQVRWVFKDIQVFKEQLVIVEVTRVVQTLQ